MQRHLDAGHKRLPLVVPMLFYHGIATPYPYSLCWLDGFTHPAHARRLYATAFPLVDITVIPDDEIVQHRRVALLEFMQKHVRQRDLTKLVEQIIAILVKEYTNDSQLKTLFNYLVYSGDAPRFGRFIRELARRAPQHHKEELMTIAERLQEVGRRKGKIEGRHEGQLAEGLRIARMMLANGIALETVLRITGLSEEEVTAAKH